MRTECWDQAQAFAPTATPSPGPPGASHVPLADFLLTLLRERNTPEDRAMLRVLTDPKRNQKRAAFIDAYRKQVNGA